MAANNNLPPVFSAGEVPSASSLIPAPVPQPFPFATAGTAPLPPASPVGLNTGVGSSTGSQPVVPGPAKKGFPKIVLFIVPIVLILLGVAAYFLRGYLPKFGQEKPSNEITWWGLWEDDSVVAPLIAEYENKNPGMKIKYIRQSQKDYRERLINSLAKGEGPDVFRFHNSWVPMFKNNLDSMPASVMSAGDFSKSYYPVAVSDLTLGTGIVGIPLEYDGLALFINDDIFAKAGKTPPATWDELRGTAIALTVKDEKGNLVQSGAAMGRTENIDHWQEILALMMIQNGVDLNKPTGKLAEDALSYYCQFVRNYGLWDPTWPSSTISFAAGKVAMYFAPSWRVFEIKNQNPNLKFRTVPLPQLPKANVNEPNFAYATYWVEGVWVKSKNKALAWDFLKFISGKDSLTKLYQSEVKIASKVRPFGEPYPFIAMANLMTSDPVLGTIISQAPSAKSWYLASRTWDGPTGINTQISKYFEDAVNSVNKGGSAQGALTTVASGVAQVLAQYGMVVR